VQEHSASKYFFFEKKKQKTFALETVVLETPVPSGQKFFGVAFLQKSDRFLALSLLSSESFNEAPSATLKDKGPINPACY
jgi:hypothetical protein